MKVLVLNCGSSSVKFQLLDMETEAVLTKGLVEKIGSSHAILSYQSEGKNKIREVQEISDHRTAIHLAIRAMTDPKTGSIQEISEIDAIGHRLVHGGEEFSSSVLIDEKVIESIEYCSQFAPLHNPHNLKGVEICKEAIPGVPNVGVFDTAFHQTMPAESYIYGLPYALYRKLGIRRYGFHGTSHKFVSRKAAEILDRPVEDLKIVTCHLGNGASIAAIKNGISVDTSMGFTPLEGLVMGTRCGSIDPALVSYLIKRENLTPDQVDNLMNKSSGMLGITESSNDFREIEEEATQGNEQHKLALKIFCHRVKQYIGAYAAILGGLDILVFTGGIGENSDMVRKNSLEGLEFMGIELDDDKNREHQLSIGKGKVQILVVPTNEELEIARDTVKVVHKQRASDADTEEAGQIPALSREQRKFLLVTWAKDSSRSVEELSAQLSREFGRKITPDRIKKELESLDLIEVH